MNAIIIIAVIAVFYVNYIFIDNIYKIVDSPMEPIHVSKKISAGSLKEALILGDDATCRKISDLLKKHNISTDILNDIDDIDKSYPYKYILALFNDDLENLTACSIAANIMEVDNIIAICNKQYNQKIFDENHITSLRSNTSATEIVSLLLNFQHRRGA
ncbi:MAG: hypothetical protein AB7V48_08085 [Sedimentibacter sp.]